MAKGTVKWFDLKKGFGFVINDRGEDVFVHWSSIEGDGFKCLRSEQVVEYEQFDAGKGLQGKGVRIIEMASAAKTTMQDAETAEENGNR